MLSEEKAMSKLEEKKRLRALPELNPPRTVRMKFRKVGSLQYISHLDLQRTFMRILVRACIPTWYTKGFNPHAKLVFSTPLSVGAQSIYEFLDVRIDRDMPCEEIMERMNREMTEELCLTEVYLPTRDFSEIAWASYDLEINTRGANQELAKNIRARLTSAPLYMTKKTKSGEKEIDVVSMIHSVEADYRAEEGTVGIRAILKATSAEFLNPELLISALKREFGILASDPAEEWYTILRTSVLDSEMNLFR